MELVGSCPGQRTHGIAYRRAWQEHGVAVPWNDEDFVDGMGRVGARRLLSVECLFGTDGAPSGPWEIEEGDPNSGRFRGRGFCEYKNYWANYEKRYRNSEKN